jgi:methyl-accepting chemotaxis protein/hemerythrin
MEVLIWSNAYSIGNDLVDGQHHKLMDLINKLYGVGEENLPEVERVLAELIDYTVYHFQAEENLQQTSGYPGFEAHKQEHTRLIAAVSEKVAAFRSGDEALREDLLVFLVDWLKDHILAEDKKLGIFLAEKNAGSEADDL